MLSSWVPSDHARMRFQQRGSSWDVSDLIMTSGSEIGRKGHIKYSMDRKSHEKARRGQGSSGEGAAQILIGQRACSNRLGLVPGRSGIPRRPID